MSTGAKCPFVDKRQTTMDEVMTGDEKRACIEEDLPEVSASASIQ